MGEKSQEKSKAEKAPLAGLAGAAPSPQIAEQKTDIRALTRGDDPGGGGGGEMMVGAANDAAEKEADALADKAVAAPELSIESAEIDTSDVPEPERDKDKASAEILELSSYASEQIPGRGPPNIHTGLDPPVGSDQPGANQTFINDGNDVVRRMADANSQPDTDTLSSVPTLDPGLAEVSVSGQEETDFEETLDGDWSTLESAGTIMMKRELAPDGAFSASSIFSSRIRTASGGVRLPGYQRRHFERVFNTRLDHVRIHVAPELARMIGARAFAHANNIWLRSAADVHDRKLMAHETVHVLQQTSARGPPAKTKHQTHSRAPPSGRVHARAPPLRLHSHRSHRQNHRQNHSRITSLVPSRRQSEFFKTNAVPVVQGRNDNVVRRFTQGEPEPEPDTGLLAQGAERLADNLDSYQVLKVIIGRKLFTGETVTRTATNFLGAFMRFVGAEETFEQMQQSGTIESGFQYISDRFAEYDLTWDRVNRVFQSAYDDFDWWSPIESFTSIFSPFFSDVLSFAADVLKKIAEMVAEAFVISFGPWGRAVWEKIVSIGESISLVIADPGGFAINLIRAVVQGIQGFASRIWTHIKKGFLTWILGPFASMGITLPETLDLRGIMSIILQVLGLTYPQLRPRIVRKLDPYGEIKVSVVEKMIEVVQLIRDEGVAGVWRKLIEYAGNLQQAAIESIKGWAIQAIVTAGIRILANWTNPAGAVIEILLGIYNLIMFFIERFEQILDFANSVFESIGNIARGQLNQAADYIENAMAQTIPIIISFLVRLLGLPDIGGAVRRFITAIQEKVHAAFDKMLDWILDKVKKLFARLVSRFKADEGTPEDSLTLQGEPHTMVLEDSGGTRKLMVRPGSAEMTSDYLQTQTDIMGNICEEPLTTELKPNLAAAVTELRTLEQDEAALARRPAPNRDTPTEAARRDTQLAAIKTKLEAGTNQDVMTDQESDSGVEVNPDQLGREDEVTTDTIPEHQKDQVKNDFDNPVFRFVLLNENVDGEGFSGPWSQAKVKRDEIKASFNNGDDDKSAGAKYLIELDHNPEHQILWRLAFLEFDPPPPERVDDPSTPIETEPKRKYPGLAAQYSKDPGGPSGYERDWGPGAMAMATRREVNTSEINFQAESVKVLNEVAKFDESRKRYVHDPTKTLPDFKNLVLSKSGDHKNALIANYQTFYDAKDTDQATFDAIQRNGQGIINATAAYFDGATEPGQSAAGSGSANLSGIGLRADPVDAELQHGKYSDALGKKNEKEFGNVLETHHMIEQSVLRKLREKSGTALNVGQIMKGKAEGLGGWAPSGQTAYDVLAETVAQKKTVEGKAINQSTEKSVLSRMPTIDVRGAFDMTRDITADGFSVNVMRQVNQLAGSSSANEPLQIITNRQNEIFDIANSRAQDAVREAYGELPDEGITKENLKETRAKAKELFKNSVSEKTDMQQRDAVRQAVRGAATAAHGTFRRLQSDSMNMITPAEENAPVYDDYTDERGQTHSPRRVLADLRQRDAALADVAMFQQENENIWVV